MRKAEEVLTESEIIEIVEDEITPFKITEKELKEKYDLQDMLIEFNNQFFNFDFIEDVEIKWSKRLTRVAGNCWRYASGRKVIKLSVYYFRKFPEEVKSVLLHEMIHLEVNGHGREFRAEIDRVNNELGTDLVSRFSQEAANIKYLTYCPECKEISGRYSKKTQGIKHGSYYHIKCDTHTHVIEVDKYI